MAEIAVNPRMLAWARAEVHMDLADAAVRLGLEIPALESLESGKASPTLTTLRRMASVYRLPVATLAMPEAPAASRLPKDYRTIDGKPREITPETAVAIRKARR